MKTFFWQKAISNDVIIHRTLVKSLFTSDQLCEPILVELKQNQPNLNFFKEKLRITHLKNDQAMRPFFNIKKSANEIKIYFQ